MRWDVESLGQHLDSLRSPGSRDPHERADEAVATLETAYRELRVTGEELSAQQTQLQDLLVQFQGERASRDVFCMALPLPVITTDATGVIRSANLAAASVLRASPRHLRGKPLASFVDVPGRRDLRTLASTALAGAAEQSGVVPLRPRRMSRAAGRASDAPTPQWASVIVVPDGSVDHRGLRWLLAPWPVSGGPDAGPGAVGTLVSILADATTAEDLGTALNRAVATVAERLGPGRPVSVTVGAPTAPELQAWDGPLSQAGDAAQLAAGEGPCVEAWRSATQVSTGDAGTDPRWPGLDRHLAGTGLHAVVAAPLVAARDTLGVLNVYALALGTLPAALAEEVRLFAAVFGAVVHDTRRRRGLEELADQLKQALTSRAVIDQALGIIMGQRRIDADAAFRELVRASQNRNIKVRDLARLIVAAVCEAPGPGPGRIL
ncbi:MAG TPA: ANTAR domain-containing protein [Mycobacteriales bacterium]